MHELASMAANKAQERNAQHNELPSDLILKVINIYECTAKMPEYIQKLNIINDV